jgi:hypothetical protein
MEVGRELGPDALLLVNLSGRGDKDMHTAAAYFGLVDDEAQASPSAGAVTGGAESTPVAEGGVRHERPRRDVPWCGEGRARAHRLPAGRLPGA